MTTIRDERGSSLLLLIGLLLIGVGTLFTAVNATHYFLKKQALQNAIDRTLMIAINYYDFTIFRESGDFLDIRLNEPRIEAELPLLLSSALPESEVKELLITRDSILLKASFVWTPPIGAFGVGNLEISAKAMIKSQILDAPA